MAGKNKRANHSRQNTPPSSLCKPSTVKYSKSWNTPPNPNFSSIVPSLSSPRQNAPLRNTTTINNSNSLQGQTHVPHPIKYKTNTSPDLLSSRNQINTSTQEPKSTMSSASMSRNQRQRKKNPTSRNNLKPLMEKTAPIPTHFRCPISLDLMKDPVTASTGITYDRHSIERWLEMGNPSCPITNTPITGGELIPNHTIRRMIQDWCVANPSLGFDRIPTPRIPLSKTEAIRILLEIRAATLAGDSHRCCHLVVALRDLARESDRNKQCLFSNGAGRELTSSFAAFSRSPGNRPAALEEIVTATAAMLPLDEVSCEHMASHESLTSLVRVLRFGDLARRVSAAMVVKELANPIKGNSTAISDTEGLVEALVGLVKEPISPRATKSALMAAHYMASSSKNAARKIVDLGMVDPTVEILVDAERSTAEKALVVIDDLCRTEVGRREVRRNALAVPALAKRMLRVSEAATQFAVSALWSVCEEGPDWCLREAVQVGVFQKLLLVLQVGCGDATKDKATKLLKLLHGHGGRNGCLSSFGEIKRAS